MPDNTRDNAESTQERNDAPSSFQDVMADISREAYSEPLKPEASKGGTSSLPELTIAGADSTKQNSRAGQSTDSNSRPQCGGDGKSGGGSNGAESRDGKSGGGSNGAESPDGKFGVGSKGVESQEVRPRGGSNGAENWRKGGGGVNGVESWGKGGGSYGSESREGAGKSETERAAERTRSESEETNPTGEFGADAAKADGSEAATKGNESSAKAPEKSPAERVAEAKIKNLLDGKMDVVAAQNALRDDLRNPDTRMDTYNAMQKEIQRKPDQYWQEGRVQSVLDIAKGERIRSVDGNIHDGLGRVVDLQGLQIKYGDTNPKAAVAEATNGSFTFQRKNDGSYDVVKNASGKTIFSGMTNFRMHQDGVSANFPDNNWTYELKSGNRKH